MVNTKGKKETTTKGSTRDASPKKSSAKERPDKSPKKTSKETPSKVYRKSPSRAEVSKSPSRVKKSPSSSPVKNTRPKSPARKSPSRKSPVQKSSPGRSPARKSPGRKPISETVTKTSASKSRVPVLDVESDSDNADLLLQIEKPKAAVRGRARRLDTERNASKVVLQDIKRSAEKEIESYIGVVRRSVQKAPPPEVERIVHLQHEPALKKLSEFSDEDDIIPTEKVEPKVIERCYNIGLSGTIRALVVFCVTPLIAASLHIVCNETHCSLSKWPSFQRYRYFSTYFDKNVFFLFFAYTILLAVLNSLPFGGPKVSGMPNKQGKLIYRLNGLFIAAIAFAIVFSLEFFNISVITIILQKYFQTIVSGIIIGCFLSLIIYLVSFIVPISALNPRAITGSRLHNFNIGREVNPRILKNLDVKVFLLRTYKISIVLLNSIFIYKSLEFIKSSEDSSDFDIRSLRVNPTLLVIGALQIIYSLDFLVFEKSILTTSFVQYEGIGYWATVTAFTGMFCAASGVKYIYDFKVALPIWQLLLSVLLFCCGYFLYRGSNLQKHAFRLNPYSPSVSHLETLVTSHGKKLLVSGFWGLVRHPNYLGDIIIQLSFASFVLLKPPIIAYLLHILILIYKAHQDGVRCKEVYCNAWDRYCQRVKYILVPKVY